MADKFVSGVDFTGPFFVLPKSVAYLNIFFNTLVFAGISLGFLNFFIKPILNKISLPLRIITFNLFSLVLAMFMIWLIDLFFPELIIKGITALFFTAILVWAITFFLLKWFPEGRRILPREKRKSKED